MFIRHDASSDTALNLTCLITRSTDTPIFSFPETLLLKSSIANSDSGDDVTVLSELIQRDDGRGQRCVSDLMNKLIAVFAGVVPQSILAEIHRREEKPK